MATNRHSPYFSHVSRCRDVYQHVAELLSRFFFMRLQPAPVTDRYSRHEKLCHAFSTRLAVVACPLYDHGHVENMEGWVLTKPLQGQQLDKSMIAAKGQSDARKASKWFVYAISRHACPVKARIFSNDSILILILIFLVNVTSV